MERLSIDEVIEHCNKTCDMTEKIAKARGHKLESIESKQFWEHYQVREWLKELKTYKDAEEQGLLLRLPFKIGQKVYYIYESCIDKSLTIGIMIYSYSCLDFPREYFATKEEAEQELKETKKCKYVKDNGLCGKNPACTSSGKCEEYCSYFESALKQMGE